MTGFNRHKKKSWKYPDIESARRPIPRGEEVSVPKLSETPNLSENEENDNKESSSCSSVFEDSERNLPRLITPEGWNDMTRVLGHSK